MFPFLAGPSCWARAVHWPRAGGVCRTGLWESHCVPMLLAGHSHTPGHGTCPLPSPPAASQSLLVQLWFCLWIYSHSPRGGLLGCLNRKLPTVCHGMSGCKSHMEGLSGLFTFTLVIMSVKRGWFQNLTSPPNPCSQVSQVRNRKLFCIKVRLCF